MNKDYQIVTFKDEDFSIDIKISLEEETIWMTQKEIASVFETSSANISLLLKTLIRTNDYHSSVIKFYLTTAQDGKKYNTKIYNLEIITLLSYKVRSKRAPKFISWANNIIKELKDKQQLEMTDSYNNLLHRNNYLIVPCKYDDVNVDLKYYPKENTIWSTIQEIAEIFHVTYENVRQHIRNIIDDQEFKNPTYKNFLEVRFEGGRNVTRKVIYYNLNMIISVGYRVNSKQGTAFRIWSSELETYFLTEKIKEIERKSYNLENIMNGDFQLDSVQKAIKLLLEDYFARNNVFIKQGDSKKAFNFLYDIFSNATQSIVIMDPYIDKTIISYLDIINNNVSIKIVTSNLSKSKEDDITLINKYFTDIKIYYDDSFHDRYIVVDEDSLYVVGASLKDISKKSTTIVQVLSKTIIKELNEIIKTKYK